MSFASQWTEKEQRRRVAGAGLTARPALIAHDTEHAWRSSGEWAIREEMERRLAVYFARRIVDRAARLAALLLLEAP